MPAGWQDSWRQPENRIRLAVLATAVLLFIFLIAVAIQSWFVDWPGRLWLTLAVGGAVALSLLLARIWRPAPLTIAVLSWAVLLLISTYLYGSDSGGLGILGLPFDTLIAGLFLLATGLAAGWLIRLPRLPLWAKVLVVALAVYAWLPVILALAKRQPFASAVKGLWPMPYWLQGVFLGTDLLLLAAWIILLVLLFTTLRSGEGRQRSLAVMTLVPLTLVFLLVSLEMNHQGLRNLVAFLPTAEPAPRVVSVEREIAPQVVVEDSSRADPGEDWLDRCRGPSLEETFLCVAREVRYEPYRGAQRGALLTALAQSGNAVDQSLLLSEILREQGYRVRFVTGTLAEANLSALVRGMYPPHLPTMQLAEEHQPYSPAADDELRQMVKSHLWLEVDQGGTWLPLDPSFPRAEVGESYAQAAKRFEELPEELFQSLRITLNAETVDGSITELGKIEGTLVELAQRPITLTIRGLPSLTPTEDEQERGSPLDVFGGGLTGGGRSEEENGEATREVIGRRYRPVIRVGDEAIGFTPLEVVFDKRGSFPRREWIDFELQLPDVEAKRIRRYLYLNAGDSSTPTLPPGLRHYAITLVAGSFPRQFVEQQREVLTTDLDPERWREQLDRLTTNSDTEEAGAALQEASQIDSRVAGVEGFLTNLIFAHESDLLAAKVAYNNGVNLARALPRILITSFETSSGDQPGEFTNEVSLDLRLDELATHPFPGVPSGAAQQFQLAFGLQESTLEAGVLARLTPDARVVSTVELVENAYQKGGSLVTVTAADTSALSDIVDLSKRADLLIREALAEGLEIILPSVPLTIEGRKIWGWWQRNPETGVTVGALDSGQHQAVVEYSISLKEIGLNEDTAFALGLIKGAEETLWLLAEKILRYGEITAELLKEVEEHLKKLATAIACGFCPKLEYNLSAGIKITQGCWEWKKSKDLAKASVGADFCSSFLDGFNCASGMILAGLKGDSAGASGKIWAGEDITIVCKSED
ncbi:MAG: transglutaminase domain-containing protein [Thermoanaerobaculia bacterium]